jgi:hypothetical protein
MAREEFPEDKNSRLKIVAEIIMPARVNLQATELFADRLRDFLLGPRMPGWCDTECFTVKIVKVKEPADGKEIS